MYGVYLVICCFILVKCNLIDIKCTKIDFITGEGGKMYLG